MQLHSIRKILWCLAGFISICFAAFNFYYLTHSHNQLLFDYFKLNNCFYKSESFAANYFNITTKYYGNIFSILSLLLCGIVIYLSIRKIKLIKPDFKEEFYFRIPKDFIPFYLVITGLSVLTWLYGVMNVAVSYDEVFSAGECAELPFFQTLTYYMLPNNHIGFNLLNKILFFWVEDKVLSGKIISLVAYLLLNYISFFTLQKLLLSKKIALVGTLVLALQFPVWGFAFEARGYELYCLAEVISFFSLIAYARNPQRKFLLVNCIASIIGYTCLPTFLYLHLAQLLFGLWLYFKSKNAGLVYYRYQLYIVVGTFLFYLPSLCYSGLAAFTQNKYVHAVDTSYYQFSLQTFLALPSYFEYAFSNISIGIISLGLIFSLQPFVLIFNKKIKHKEVLVLTILFMLLTLLIMILMRRIPYHRNLIGHFYVLLFTGIYMLHFMLNQLDQKINTTLINRYVMPVLLLVMLAIMGFRNSDAFNFLLYFDDLRLTYTASQKVLAEIPEGSTVACSNGSFYIYYQARQQNYQVKKCGLNQTMYYIIDKEEEKSEVLLENYELKKQVSDYYVYIKKTIK